LAVFAGIKAAQAAGFKRIKLNCVALKHYNADEVPALVQFALDEGLDISFIEEMPLGRIDEHGRAAEFVSSDELRSAISEQHLLQPVFAKGEDNAGPAQVVTTRASVLSRPIRIISAAAAIAYVSRQLEDYYCAWDKRTAWICARHCAPAKIRSKKCARVLSTPCTTNRKNILLI
jgi:MoaA/NifB/PqqE/SkfB family radical SAM enzyme